MPRSVFLIYDAVEKPFARQLAIDLSLAGATVWLEESETRAFQESLLGNIDKETLGDVFLAVILSPNSVRSDCVQHAVEMSLNRRVAGLTLNVLPLLYKSCSIPASMADKLCADFRNPADYPSMLRRVIDRLELVGNGQGPILSDSIAGMWQGSWTWCGRRRDADMCLSALPILPSRMIIRYLKSGILSIVEQELDVRISGNAVKLIGTGYRLLERGISLGWNLDTFNLSIGATGVALEGIITDKRGAKSPVMFVRR